MRYSNRVGLWGGLVAFVGCATPRAIVTQPAPSVSVAHSEQPPPATNPEDREWALEPARAYLARSEELPQDAEAAQRAVERCLSLSNDAECHHLLAQILDRQAQPGLALEHYFAALRQAPSVASYYPRPVELCYRYKLYDAAIGIIQTALAQLPDESPETYELWGLWHNIAQARHDQAAKVTALESVYSVWGGRHPEVGFVLADAYAAETPPRKREAISLYQEFIQNACGADEAKTPFVEMCPMARTLNKNIGGQELAEGETASPVAVHRQPKSGVIPPLPAVPTVPERPLRVGSAYTVWGASVAFRGRRELSDPKGTVVSITGVIGRSNVTEAPSCALHAPSIADPRNCSALLPAFWLCDSSDADMSDCIKVMGWASNYAQIWGAVVESRLGNLPYRDRFWRQEIPVPIPQAGAKVTVTGRYGPTFTLASSGVQVDLVMGLLTYRSLSWVEAPRADAPELLDKIIKRQRGSH
jgi:hypothetical protein